MKSSILRGAMLFAAGVGCTVVAQVSWTPPPEPEEVLEKRLNQLLIDVSQLGRYVTFAENGRVIFNLNPARCPTPIPLPKLPANAVDPITLRMGAAALFTADEAYMMGAEDPMGSDDRCHIAR